MLANVQQATIRPVIEASVAKGALVHTDEYDVYARLKDCIASRSAIPSLPPKRAKSAIEASTMRKALETTIERRRKRASQCRWRAWSRSIPCVSSLPTNSRPGGTSSAYAAQPSAQ
jgi:hypothetical protein